MLAGAEAFELGDGPVGALMAHGFTSTPDNLRALGGYLAERGIKVVAPRLPGHGTTWQDLATRTGRDWTDELDASFHRLQADRELVFVVGLSFGSALALGLAARYPERVAGTVCLAPYVVSKDPRRFLSPVVRRLLKSVPGVGNDIADSEMREIVYDRIPTSAAAEMLRYIRTARRSLPSVISPLLVIHSRNDHTAHPSNAEFIHDMVSSPDKQIVWLQRSYHVITIDVDREEVYERTYNFIKERSRGAL